LLERFADEIDGLFDDFGLGRSSLTQPWRQDRSRPSERAGAERWAPAVEVFQQNHDLIVRAELPGLKKEDVNIDVTEHDVIITGERRQEQETERNGVYRSERSYGSFYRAIPLPEGAMTDQAKATFNNGVLEIRMPAPPEHVTRGRRLEIKDGTDAKR
jgi:HSP20 family protein